jgi:hypothetical protein
MVLFVTGIIFGFTLGLILLALLNKSKEADATACRVIEQAPSLAGENLLISRS